MSIPPFKLFSPGALLIAILIGILTRFDLSQLGLGTLFSYQVYCEAF